MYVWMDGWMHEVCIAAGNNWLTGYFKLGFFLCVCVFVCSFFVVVCFYGCVRCVV
jgi:hypothetical protein